MFTPQYIKDGNALAKAAQRIINYRKDVAKQDQLQQARKQLDDLKLALKERSTERVRELEKGLLAVLGRIEPPSDRHGIRENVELFLVAIALALGIRAFYLQPFKIPTGSMQPTLNGVIARQIDGPPPNPVVRSLQFLTLGRTYEDVVAQQEGDAIAEIRPTKLNFLWDGSAITMSSGRIYRVGIEPRVLREQLGVFVGQTFSKGQPILRGYADLGDQLFVDKMSYNFVGPHRGDVFVFKTNGIVGAEQGPDGSGEHYIKRLAGVPGDTLRIDPPRLYINGQAATQFVFRRVASQQNGYSGFVNDQGGGMRYLRDPEATVSVGQGEFFALGDNSANSADSRYWGFVPAENVVGRGLFVYWPFSSHWGFVQ
ncbi:MAG: signal peptidase I [Chthoniobacterales bacterium]